MHISVYFKTPYFVLRSSNKWAVFPYPKKTALSLLAMPRCNIFLPLFAFSRSWLVYSGSSEQKCNNSSLCKSCSQKGNTFALFRAWSEFCNATILNPKVYTRRKSQKYYLGDSLIYTLGILLRYGRIFIPNGANRGRWSKSFPSRKNKGSAFVARNLFCELGVKRRHE